MTAGSIALPVLVSREFKPVAQLMMEQGVHRQGKVMMFITNLDKIVEEPNADRKPPEKSAKTAPKTKKVDKYFNCKKKGRYANKYSDKMMNQGCIEEDHMCT